MMQILIQRQESSHTNHVSPVSPFPLVRKGQTAYARAAVLGSSRLDDLQL